MSLTSSNGSGSSLGGSSLGSRPKVNLRSTAVKRIMQEAAELADGAETADEDFVAAPLENDIFEWHCTMRGVEGSEYEGGIYHFRLVLPSNYPMAPPDILLLTPNGRFELGKKICIDGLTSFHVGSWQPAWGVRTAILGLRSFWMQGGEALAAVGALNCSTEERRRLAKLSRSWKCPSCGAKNEETLPARSHTSCAILSADGCTSPKADNEGGSRRGSASLNRDGSIANVPVTNNHSTRSNTVPIDSTPSSSDPPHGVFMRAPRGPNTDGSFTAQAQVQPQSQTHHRFSPPAISQLSVRRDASPNTERERSSSPLPLSTVTGVPARTTPLWLDALIGITGAALLLIIWRRLLVGSDSGSLLSEL